MSWIVINAVLSAGAVAAIVIAMSEYRKYRKANEQVSKRLDELPSVEESKRTHDTWVAKASEVEARIRELSLKSSSASAKYQQLLHELESSMAQQREKAAIQFANAETKYSQQVEQLENRLVQQKEKVAIQLAKSKKIATDLISQQSQALEAGKAKVDCAISDYRESLASKKQELSKRETELTKAEDKIAAREGVVQIHVLAEQHGFVPTKFEFDDSDSYKDAIKHQEAILRRLISDDKACIHPDAVSIGTSDAEGRRFVKSLIKMAISALNGVTADARSKVTSANYETKASSINRSFDQVNKHIGTLQMSIGQQYLDGCLRLLRLDYERSLVKAEEKERSREMSERMREEAKAQKELEKAQAAAEKEERMAKIAFDKAHAEMNAKMAAAEAASAEEKDSLTAELEELKEKLAEAHEKAERTKSMAEQTKIGHVYVISNPAMEGNFKVGMTRRLFPNERIDDLSGAAVPFRWNVHAMIPSEDAPALENSLHAELEDRRWNKVNKRKEHFLVDRDELKSAIRKVMGAHVPFLDYPENIDWEASIDEDTVVPMAAAV